MRVDEVIDEMKAALGVTTDAGLAKSLRRDHSSIASWRRRGSVPRKYRVTADELRRMARPNSPGGGRLFSLPELIEAHRRAATTLPVSEAADPNQLLVAIILELERSAE